MTMTAAAEAYFDKHASDWDDLRASYFGEEVRGAALAHGYLRAEHVVADVGSGTGFIAAALAPKASHVYVIDGTAAMLDRARLNLAEHANVSYHKSDGFRLPLPDGSVDAAFANMYLHHCSDPAAAIVEMVRILKPGGRVVITDMDEHDHAWMREEMADEWLGFSRADVKRWLREAGLVNVMVDCTGKSCCAASERQPDLSAQISVFVATGSRRIAVRELVQARYGATAERVAPSPCCGSSVASTDSAATIDVIPLASSCCSPAPEQAKLDAAVSSCCSSMTNQAKVEAVASPCCSSTTANTAVGNAMPEVGGALEGASFIWDLGYTREEFNQLPPEVAALSLGCGNPTAFASLKVGETVLDIGSGGGIDAFFAASRVGPAGHVIGVDMTAAMLQRARDSGARAGLTNVEFREGNAEALPVEDGSVDVIMSNCVINLCEDKGQVFEEAFRVLKPGGRLAVSDTVAAGPLPLWLRTDTGSWGACISGALPEAEYLDLVRSAGFKEVTGQRSLSHGSVDNAEVYSLSVTAVK